MRPRPKLAASFALMGLMGGWLAGHLTVGSESEVHILILLTVITPISCALLGGWLADRVHQRWVLKTLLGTLVAGAANGMAVGLFAGAIAGVMIGFVCGLLFCLPFVPANLLVVAAAHRVGRAPTRSLVDGLDRRGLWRATALAIALASTLTVRGYASWRAQAACLAALAVVALVFALDLAARARLIRLRALLPRLQAHDPARHVGDPGEAGTLALGLGDGRLDEIAVSESPYREPDRVVRAVTGDPARAAAALRGALLYDLVALAVTALATGVHLLAR